MKDNIQEPVSIDIRKLVSEYGSHFRIDYSCEKIVERIGLVDSFNKWEHECDTVENARSKMLNHFEVLKRKERENYLDKISPMTWRIINTISFLKLPTKRIINNVKKYKGNISAVEDEIKHLKDGSYDIEVEMLSGEYTIPKYMPENGKTYYHVNMLRLDNVGIYEVSLKNVDIYDYRNTRTNDVFADQFDFRFTCELSGKNTTLHLDSDRLFKFNGLFWQLSSHGEYLFLDKQEALLFIKKAINDKIASLSLSKEHIESQLD